MQECPRAGQADVLRRRVALTVAASLCLPLASCGGGGEAAPALQQLVIDPGPVRSGVGARTALGARATYSDGSSGEVTTQARWRSSDPAVATVGQGTGVVQGIATGSATISAEFGDRTASVRVDIVPAWRSAGQLLTPRVGPQAVVLRDSRVLVLGGTAAGAPVLEAELFEPASGRSGSAGAWAEARHAFSATLLADGRVLVVGGQQDASMGFLRTALLFDPQRQQWTSAASAAQGRAWHTATLLADGRVLVIGGANGSSTASGNEIYDPPTDSWSAAPAMRKPRSMHTATLLPDGRVLVIGGFDGGADGSFTGSLQPTDRLELFDPRASTWSVAPALPPVDAFSGPGGRFGHTASLLSGGQVLVAGGNSYNNIPTVLLPVAARFDPASSSWAPAGTLVEARYFHAATALPAGRVLVGGGFTNGGLQPVPPETFDPDRSDWSATLPLVIPRTQFSLVTLADGTALVVGGAAADGQAVAAVEAYR